MVDADAIRRRLRQIDRRIGLLQQLRNRGNYALLKDVGVQAQAERHLQLVIQLAIDIALHIAAEDSAGTPEDYRSAFKVLADLDILTDELAARLGSAAGLRNILVHAYLEVDPQQIWDHLSHLDDLRRFATAVERYARDKE